jgi:alpha-L-rhamnosidase
MNSHNHVMLVGDLMMWFYEYLGGIRPSSLAPGFKQIVLKPVPVEGLDHVRATHESLYGTIASAWKRTGNTFSWNVTVPTNTSATVHVPASDAASVKEGGVPLANAPGISDVRQGDGTVVCTVRSGTYVFESVLK